MKMLLIHSAFNFVSCSLAHFFSVRWLSISYNCAYPTFSKPILFRLSLFFFCFFYFYIMSTYHFHCFIFCFVRFLDWIVLYSLENDELKCIMFMYSADSEHIDHLSRNGVRTCTRSLHHDIVYELYNCYVYNFFLSSFVRSFAHLLTSSQYLHEHYKVSEPFYVNVTVQNRST